MTDQIPSVPIGYGGPSRLGVYDGETPAGPGPGTTLVEFLSGYSGNTYGLASQYLYLLEHPDARFTIGVGPFLQRDILDNTLEVKAKLTILTLMRLPVYYQVTQRGVGEFRDQYGAFGGYYAGFSAADLAAAGITTEDLSAAGIDPSFVSTGWYPALLPGAVFTGQPGQIPPGSSTWVPTPTPPPDPRILAAILKDEGYVTNLRSVPNPTAQQQTELAFYERRIAAYKQRVGQ